MKDPIAWRVVRYLFAAYYLYIGVLLSLSLLGVTPPLHPRAGTASGDFQAALAKTGFIDPALAVVYIASACALFFYRTAPLGVVILAPVEVVIFLTDTLLDTAWLWGTLHAAVLLALAWHFRAAFLPLWSYSDDNFQPVVKT